MQTSALKGFDTDAARILVDRDLTERQVSFIWNYLQGMTKDGAATASGYLPGAGSTVFRGAKVQAALAACMDRFLVGELAPMALRTAHKLMDEDRTPPGVKASLVLGILDRAGFSAKRHEKGDQLGKDPSTMTPDELQAQIDKLQAQIEAKMRDITPIDAPSVAQDIDLYP